MQSTPVRIGTTTPIFYASVVRLRIVSITTGRTRSDYLSPTPVNYTFPSLIMSKSVMLSLLNRAADGNQLLSILDTFVENDEQSSDNQPTLDVIEF